MRTRRGTRPHPFAPARTRHPGGREKGPDFTRGLQRTEYTLFLAAVVLITAGAVSDSWWLIGSGAWALIAAGLIEMIYRP
ncbi:hypothetical protein [Streptomyces sp. WZ.A104]|uniref:hypothetical protein n=1 Tax=Streptomyces sp. WZ.A104 TaxID=2023771 RepID=UPI000D1B7130|nr:hypothetical protein [Streptomyces sp. WZ.A104]